MNPQNENHNPNEFHIPAPIEPKALAEFISSLLGQQQSIRRRIIGKYSVDLNWLINTHELLYQRISRQNSGQLTEFSADIHFQDGLARQLKSIEALKSFVEVKPVRTIAAEVHWTFLIQFPDKKSPEKQDIRLVLSTERGTEVIFSPTGKPAAIADSHIDLEIEYTERTWGDDIEAVLKNHISDVVKRRGKCRKFFQEWYPTYALVLFFAAISLGFYITSYWGAKDRQRIVNDTVGRYEGVEPTIESISKKIDDILISVGHVSAVDYAWISVLVFFFAIALMISIGIAVFSSEYSYILITDRDRTKKSERDVRRKHRVGIATAIAIGIVTSLIAAVIFTWWTA